MNRRFYVREVTGRNEDRFFPASRSHDCAHFLISVIQEGTRTLFRRGRFEFTDEPLFRTTDCGNSRHDPEMRGNAKSAGMGRSMTVNENKVDRDGETMESLQDGRNLPEGKITGDVGKVGFMNLEYFHNGQEPRKRENYRSRKYIVSVFQVGNVDSADRFDAPNIQRSEPERLFQAFLNLSGILDSAGWHLVKIKAPELPGLFPVYQMHPQSVFTTFTA